MYGINSNRLNPIRNFAEAKAYYENTSPIRGYIKDLYGVPLHKKRERHNVYRLVRKSNRYEESHGESYACRLYETDIITWHADGTVMLDVTYFSQTTREFARFYMPHYGVAIYPHEGRHVVRDDVGHYKASTKPVRLIKVGAVWRVDASTAKIETRPVLDKSKAAAVRKELRPFMQYVKTMRALGPIHYKTWLEMRDNVGLSNALMESMTDERKFLSVVLACYINEYHRYNDNPMCRIPDHAEARLREAAYKERGCYNEVPLM